MRTKDLKSDKPPQPLPGRRSAVLPVRPQAVEPGLPKEASVLCRSPRDCHLISPDFLFETHIASGQYKSIQIMLVCV